MFQEMNKGNVDFNYNPEFKDIFLNTKDFYTLVDDENNERIYRVNGYFFFDSDYGKSGAMMFDRCMVYMPKHTVSVFEEISKDPDKIQAVKDGLLGVTLHTYKSHGKKCVGINLVDIDGDTVQEYPFDDKKAQELMDRE